MTTAEIILVVAGLALLAIVLATAWHCFRTGQNVVQAFLFGVNAFYNKFIWHTKLNRPMPELPPGQGAIVVANHRSGSDPMFLQYGTSRTVHWMVAKEYTTGFFLKRFFNAVGGIPAGRGGVDTAAVKTAIRIAEKGGYVGMLPEGRINTTDKLLLSGRPGAALVAIKSRAKIIPVYIEGAPYNA